MNANSTALLKERLKPSSNSRVSVSANGNTGAFDMSPSLPSASGDQSDLLRHTGAIHQQYQSVPTSSGVKFSRVNSVSTDDDGDHSLSYAPDHSGSHHISHLSSQVASLVEQCTKLTVYQHLFQTQASKAHQSVPSSGFQSFDPFSNSSTGADVSMRSSETSSNGKSRSSKVGNRVAVSMPENGDHEYHSLKRPNSFTNYAFLMDADEDYDYSNKPEHVSVRGGDLDFSSDPANEMQYTSPIKVVLHPRENSFGQNGKEAAQSPRAQVTIPSVESWYAGGRSDDSRLADEINGVTIPPSPPMSRKHAFHAGSPTVMGNNNHEKYVELLTQYHTHKKQLVDLEESLRKTNGRSLTESELNCVVEHKTLVSQIAKIRNRLKEWKSGDGFGSVPNNDEDNTKENVSLNGGNVSQEKLKKMRLAIQMSMNKLADKRREANRPFDIEQMTDVEAKIEKEQTQKELLNFEKSFGRAKTAEERQVVTVLYDRYRSLKKLVKQRPSRFSAPLSVESDITDVNSDFGENSSLGSQFFTSLYRPSSATASDGNSTFHGDYSKPMKVFSVEELEKEKALLVERKRKLTKSVNAISRSMNTYKQQADVNELRKVKTRLKQIDLVLTNSSS